MTTANEQPGGGSQQDPAPQQSKLAGGSPSGPQPALPRKIDTANYFAVGAKGGTLVILNPPMRPITPREALNLAAWLVCLAHIVEPELPEQEFQRTLAAIQNT